MKHLLHEHAQFLKQFRATFHSTGAIAPSSRFLARAITGPLQQRKGPARILEVGPGTGAVTRILGGLLRPGDHVDLVELNPEFVAILRRRLQEEPVLHAASGQMHLHECAIQDFKASGPYDFILSGLPLNNFAPTMVEEIFEVLLSHLAPGGVLSYFEYMYVRNLRKMVSRSHERRRLRQLDAVIQPYLQQHRIKRSWIFRNLPPAWVQHLTISPQPLPAVLPASPGEPRADAPC